MKYTYVLWIPTVEVGNLEILEHNLEEISLRDNDAYVGIVLSGTISDSFKIDIKYTLTNDDRERHLYFEKEWSNTTGFVVYAIHLPDVDVDDDFFIGIMRREMPTALYHYIKGFFHRHINHASDADSKLKAYSLQLDHFDFDSIKGDVFDRVFHSYDDLFSGQVKIVRKELSDALKMLSDGTNKFRNLSILERLAVSTNNVLCEVSYCEFLLNHHGQETSNPLVCEHIKQSVQTLKNDQEQLLFWNNHFHSQFSYSDGIAGVRWGVMGVVISSISLLLSFILPLFSHSERAIIDEVRKNSVEIRSMMDSLVKVNENFNRNVNREGNGHHK